MSAEEIIDDIYLAAVDPQLWPEVLDRISRTVEAAGGASSRKEATCGPGGGIRKICPTM